MPRIEFKRSSGKMIPHPQGPELKNWNVPKMIANPKDESMPKIDIFTLKPKIKPKEVLSAINKTYMGTEYSFPKTYVNQTADDLCKREKKLSAQQMFVADFMRPENPSKGILVYHGLGSGKSITSIILGESLKGNHTGGGLLGGGRSPSRIILVVPLALINQYKDTIKGWGPREVFINGVRQSYSMPKKQGELAIEKELAAIQEKMEKIKGKTKEYVELDKKKKAKQKKLGEFSKIRDAKLSNTYEIISHQRFLNLLMKRNEADGTYVEGEKFAEKGNPLRRKNTLVIIDEIQRLVSEKGSSYQKLLYALKYHSSPDIKLALLTATPIYDKPFEAALTMNLLRPRIPFPGIKEQFENIFVKKDGEDAVGSKNEDLFKYLCTGYVSYYSGGNPRSFPFKTVIDMEHRMSPRQRDLYVKVLEGELRKAIKDKQGPDAVLNFIDAANSDDKKDSMNVFMISQMYCNIALPGVDEEVQKMLDFRAGRRAYNDPRETVPVKTKAEIVSLGLENLQRGVEKKYNGSSSLSETLVYIEGYSKKYANILRLLLVSEGPVFIFSNFLDYGINAISRILNGLKFERWKPGMNAKSQKNRLRYAVWSSDTAGGKKGEEYAKTLQQVFNSEANKNGEIIKVVLGTRSIMEGVSFKNVRQVHITDPWWNEARIQQIAARAVRNCSHSSLPPEKRSVVIFKHMSAYSDGIRDQDDVIDLLKKLNAGGDLMRSFEQRTIEQYMYGKASDKMKLTHTFQRLLKESAVDCGINEHGNLDRLTEVYQQDFLGNSGKYLLTYLDPSTDILYGREDVGVQLISQEDVIKNTFGYMNNMERDGSFVFRELSQKRERVAGKKKGPRVYYLVEEQLQGVESGLVIRETIECNRTKYALKRQKGSEKAKSDLMNLYRNNILIPEISRMIKTGELKRRLYSFINSTSKKPRVKDGKGGYVYKGSMSKLRNKAKNIMMKKKYKTPHEKLVRDLIYKYEIYGVEHEDQLMELPDSYLKKEIYEEEQRRLRS